MKHSKLLLVLSSVLLTTTLLGVGSYLLKREHIKTAQEAVTLLYEFDNFNEILSEHMTPLSKLMTKEAFDSLQINDEEQSLVQYLKFKGNPSKVSFIESTDEYIIYSIQCDSLTLGRKFVFYYDTNIWGKISNVSEAELRDFYKTNYSISND